MVFFSCDGCAEMLKKNQVDAHARKCRQCASVSCVDCSVSFWGDDYRGHTSCITEAERYEKTVYKGPKKNDTSNRKLTPQEVWISVINESLSSCPPNLTRHIEKILAYENVPRKEKPFRNFASNSLNLYGRDGEATIASLWKHFINVRQKQAEEKEALSKIKKEEKDDNHKIEDISDETKDIGDEKVQTAEKIEEKMTTSVMSKPEKKAVCKAIKKALKKSPKHQLKLKELRKIFKSDSLFNDSFQGKDDWKKVIKEAVKSKKNLKIEGKTVYLMDES